MATTPAVDARRSERRQHRREVTLLGKMNGLEYQEPAHTFDLSDHGLGILTDKPIDPNRRLNTGQIVYVYGAGESPMGYCRIVWANAGDLDAPTWAGLEYLN